MNNPIGKINSTGAGKPERIPQLKVLNPKQIDELVNLVQKSLLAKKSITFKILSSKFKTYKATFRS